MGKSLIDCSVASFVHNMQIRMCETENKIAKVGQLMEPVDFGR